MYKQGIIGLILVFLLCFASYDYGTKSSKLKLEQYKKEQAELVIKEQEKLYKIIKDKESEIKNLNNRTATVLNGLQQRPQRETLSKPSVEPTNCPRAGSTGDQLFREDAEFLIREASKAEVLKQSLLSCRAVSHRSSDD